MMINSLKFIIMDNLNSSVFLPLPLIENQSDKNIIDSYQSFAIPIPPLIFHSDKNPINLELSKFPKFDKLSNADLQNSIDKYTKLREERDSHFSDINEYYRWLFLSNPLEYVSPKETYLIPNTNLSVYIDSRKKIKVRKYEGKVIDSLTLYQPFWRRFYIIWECFKYLPIIPTSSEANALVIEILLCRNYLLFQKKIKILLINKHRKLR